jgi:hypothetical protein
MREREWQIAHCVGDRGDSRSARAHDRQAIQLGLRRLRSLRISVRRDDEFDEADAEADFADIAIPGSMPSAICSL